MSECGNRLLEELKRADKENSADLCHLVAVANFFDFLGSMVMYGYFDVSTAYDLYWRAEEHYYELYRPILQDSDYKNYFECYQKLHEVFTQERASRSKSKPRPSV